MVRLLAVEYAKPDESLILVTVSMTGKSLSEMWITIQEELNTQGALTIAQECDPAGSRTTGALMLPE